MANGEAGRTVQSPLQKYWNRPTELESLSNDGITAYRQFREVHKLDIIQRQAEDSDDQRNFRSILLQLRDSKSTLDDWKVLATRFADAPTVSPIEFSDATCVLPRKSDVAEFNINKLKLLNRPVARINAIHTGGAEARQADSDTAKGLEPQLLLSRGEESCSGLTYGQKLGWLMVQ